MPAGPNLPVGINSPNSYYQWANKIIETLGLDVGTHRNSVTALIAWIAAENGQTGNNPLGTTLSLPKSHPDPNNSSGVMVYDSAEDGVTATAKTIKEYSAIANALERNEDYVHTARVIPTATNQDGNRWGTSGLVVTVALSIKNGGGIGGASWNQYAMKQVKATGHSAWRNIPVVGDDIANAQASVKDAVGAVGDALGSVGDAIGIITDPHTWYRVGQVLFGAIIIGLGIFLLTKGGPLGALAGGASGAAGKAAKGSFAKPKIGTELEPKTA